MLTYFIYPLLTGIGGWMFGVERLSWQGAVAAIVAFCGLALMIGAYPQHLSTLGIAFALGAALSPRGVSSGRARRAAECRSAIDDVEFADFLDG